MPIENKINHAWDTVELTDRLEHDAERAKEIEERLKTVEAWHSEDIQKILVYNIVVFILVFFCIAELVRFYL